MLLSLILTSMLAVMLTAMSLSLRSLSESYLRYWARRGDKISKALYPLKASGSATLLTIELFRSISLSAALVILASLFWGFWAWLIGSVILFMVFIVLSELYLKPIGTRLLAYLSPVIMRTSRLIKPITSPLGRLFDSFLNEEPVTLTRSELTNMLNALAPSDTDLSGDELRILKHALAFGEKTVHDVMTPRSVVVSVKEDDIISPVFLDELHKTGHSRFPVISADGQIASGLLYVKDLMDVKSHALVKELMHTPVHFVNEERELDHVLQAFLRTKQHMFVVVNSFAEITGLITIEDVVEQVLGKPIIDEFDKYDDMREVAEARAKIVRKKLNVVE